MSGCKGGTALRERRVNIVAGVTGEPVVREPYPRGLVEGEIGKLLTGMWRVRDGAEDE